VDRCTDILNLKIMIYIINYLYIIIILNEDGFHRISLILSILHDIFFDLAVKKVIYFTFNISNITVWYYDFRFSFFKKTLRLLLNYC